MISFGGRNWHGIVRGQGYVRVLAGRARSDMLRDSPRLTPRLTPRKNFCTTHFLFQNRSFVDFTEKSEHLDVRWGRSSWKWPFSLSKMRFALDCLMSRNAAKSKVTGAFRIWKSIIGRFSNRKWAKRPPNRRLGVHFVFENLSLVDFQIRYETQVHQTKI